MIRITGGPVAYTKVKSRFIAEQSIERFLTVQPRVWFWTFTQPGQIEGVLLWNKTEAERALKPFLDKLRRARVEHLVIWEMQKRGAWHPHILLNRYFDVNSIRAFMVKRGWGPQMKAELVKDGSNPSRHQATAELLSYLLKGLKRYLLKARTDDAVEPRKKFFGGTMASKVGNIKFAWNPATDTAHSFLYYYGRNLFCEMFGAAPHFRDLPIVMRLGVEDRDWLSVDFLYEPPYS